MVYRQLKQRLGQLGEPLVACRAGGLVTLNDYPVPDVCVPTVVLAHIFNGNPNTPNLLSSEYGQAGIPFVFATAPQLFLDPSPCRSLTPYGSAE